MKQKGQKDIFKSGVTFKQMKEIYQFDKRLRETLLYYLESIEIEFRSKIAYYHAHEFGALGYKNPDNFNRPKFHREFLSRLEKEIDRSNKELFVIHHKAKYKGLFPFWVAIEVMSFGELSKLFRNLPRKIKGRIIKDFSVDPHTASSWLHSLSYVRNICAHYGRLYGKKLSIKPHLEKSHMKNQFDNTQIFAAIFSLCKLLHQKDLQNLINTLQNLFDEYAIYIDLNDIGFPNEWEVLLNS